MKKSLFQMKGLPIITNLKFDVSKEFNFAIDQSLELEINVKTKIFAKEKKSANVELELELFPNEKNRPFYLKAISIAYFIWAEGLDEKTIEGLLKVNAPAIMLSYIRPIISNITTFSGQPPLLIPLIDLTNNN